MRKINWIIVHQSASNNPKHDNIEIIKEWHVLGRGFADVGYHWFINKAGEVFKGREEAKVGAHTKGHNSDSVGICLSGEGEKTPAQLIALDNLLFNVCTRYNLGKVSVLGHFDLAPTECPGFDLSAWLETLSWE